MPINATIHPVPPLLSIIILNYQSGLKTVECVQKCLEQTIVDDVEIIVVDNHSDDESMGILRNRLAQLEGNIRLIESRENHGFGNGYNYGVQHAQGTYILINNPDKMHEPQNMELMLEYMKKYPDVGILAPKLIHRDGSRRLSVRTFPDPLDGIIKRTLLSKCFPKRLEKYLQLDHSPDEQREVDWAIGGCIMVKKDVFDAINGFDERFTFFFEDIDLCRRCWMADKKVVYFPKAVVLDRKRRLSDGNILWILVNRVGRAHIISAIKYFQKWGIHTPNRKNLVLT